MSARQLRVLFISNSFPVGGTGAQSDSLALLADSLVAQGAAVRVIAPDRRGSTPPSSDVVQVQRFQLDAGASRSGVRAGAAAAVAAPAESSELRETDPGNGSRRNQARRAASSFLGAGFGSAVQARRDFLPDIVHAHWWFPSGLVGSWVSELSALPLVTSLHGFDPRSASPGSATRPLLRHVLQRSAMLTVESAADARRLTAVLEGFQPAIAPLPIPPELFAPAARKGAEVAVLLDPARLDTASVIAMLLSLREAGWRPVIVRTTSADDQQIQELRGEAQLAADQLVDSRQRDQLAHLLAIARATVVLGDRAEDQSSVAASMLSAAPVVQLGEEYGAHMQSEGPPRFVIRERAPRERAESVLEILSRASDLAQRGEAARMYAIATLAPESCAARMMGLYMRAIEEAAS